MNNEGTEFTAADKETLSIQILSWLQFKLWMDLGTLIII